MFRTLQKVHARFHDEIRLLRRQEHREVAIQIVETHAASIMIAMIRSHSLNRLIVRHGLPKYSFRLISHLMIVPRADRFSVWLSEFSIPCVTNESAFSPNPATLSRWPGLVRNHYIRRLQRIIFCDLRNEFTQRAFPCMFLQHCVGFRKCGLQPH
jgi:hypothetical protein